MNDFSDKQYNHSLFVKKQPLPPNVSNLNISGSLATGSNLVSATVSCKSQWILKSRSWIEFCKCRIKEENWISPSRKFRQRAHHIHFGELWVTEALAWVLPFNSGYSSHAPETMHFSRKKQYRTTKNEITSITHVDSWHRRRAYPIFLQSELVASLKLPILKHPWSALTPQKHLRVAGQRMSWAWQKLCKEPKDHSNDLLTYIYIYMYAMNKCWYLGYFLAAFTLLGPPWNSPAPVLALVVYNFLTQHFHTKVSARSSGFLAQIPLPAGC